MGGLPRWAAAILAGVIVWLVAGLVGGRAEEVLDVIAVILLVFGALLLAAQIIGGAPRR